MKHEYYTCNKCEKRMCTEDGISIEAYEGKLRVTNNLEGRSLISMNNHESIHFCSKDCFIGFFFKPAISKN